MERGARLHESRKNTRYADIDYFVNIFWVLSSSNIHPFVLGQLTRLYHKVQWAVEIHNIRTSSAVFYQFPIMLLFAVCSLCSSFSRVDSNASDVLLTLGPTRNRAEAISTLYPTIKLIPITVQSKIEIYVSSPCKMILLNDISPWQAPLSKPFCNLCLFEWITSTRVFPQSVSYDPKDMEESIHVRIVKQVPLGSTWKRIEETAIHLMLLQFSKHWGGF